MFSSIKQYAVAAVAVVFLGLCAALKWLSFQNGKLKKNNIKMEDEIDDLYSAHEIANKELTAAKHAAKIQRQANALSESSIDAGLRAQAKYGDSK